MQLAVRGSLLHVWVIAAAVAQTPLPSPPQDPAPLYVESSVVNAASPVSGGLAPNTLATIYGQYLAHDRRAIAASDIRAGMLPTTLPSTGVRVVIGGYPAPLLYVSPTQINFLVPAQVSPGISDLRVVLDNRYGPGIRVAIRDAAPALFAMDPEYAWATVAATGEILTADRPGAPGEIIALYATGLGETVPPVISGEIVQAAAEIQNRPGFNVELDGNPMPPTAILYAGLAPGFAGLYQINLRVPDGIASNPEIRIGYAGLMSPAGTRLHASSGERVRSMKRL